MWSVAVAVWRKNDHFLSTAAQKSSTLALRIASSRRRRSRGGATDEGLSERALNRSHRN